MFSCCDVECCKPTVERHLQPGVVNTCSHMQEEVSENTLVMALLTILFTYPFHLLFASCNKARAFLTVNFCVWRPWAPSSHRYCCSWRSNSLCTLHNCSYYMQRPACLISDTVDFSHKDTHRKSRGFAHKHALTGAVWWRTAPRAVLLTVPRHIAYQHPSMQTRVLNHWAISPAVASRYCCVGGNSRVTAGNGCRRTVRRREDVDFTRSTYRFHNVASMKSCLWLT